jgi:late competence protein required for DNA uptake (superfamily II DNA/RNA helicase)
MKAGTVTGTAHAGEDVTEQVIQQRRLQAKHHKQHCPVPTSVWHQKQAEVGNNLEPTWG